MKHGCLVAAVAALAAPGAATATPTFTRLSAIGVGGAPSVGVARTSNGLLHVVYRTSPGGVSAPNGLATRTISPAGKVSAETAVLQGWDPGLPGLILLPNGTLQAVFGAISPGTAPIDSVFAVSSGDGGATWGAPVDVRGGGPLESLAYGADVTAQMAGSTPVLTLPQAGGLVVQQGLGAGSPAALITTSADGAAGDINSAVDAASGEVVASWQSLVGNAGTWIQGVAPNVGPAQAVPGQIRNNIVVAGRDTGPGVFAAYTPDNNHVRLLRYGGGSIAVGNLAGVQANTLGVATGPQGRMWVMWGSDSGGFAVTRSNMAVTRFEPIQHINYVPSSLWRLYGDGRLGPLDLLVDELPPTKSGPLPPTGTFYGRVLPELSMTVKETVLKSKAGKVIGYVLNAKVTDAGDPVAGATVSAAGSSAKTNGSGAAKLTLSAATGGHVTVTATKPTYQVLHVTVG
jgi:hypothetical protein